MMSSLAISPAALNSVAFSGTPDKNKVTAPLPGHDGLAILSSMDPVEMESLLDKLKHENELRTLDNPAYWAKRFEQHPPKSLNEWRKYYTHGPGSLRYKTPRLKRFFAFARPKRLVNATRDTLRMIRSLPKQDRAMLWGGLAWDLALDGFFLLSTFGLWAIPMVMTTWGSNVAKRTFYHSVMSQYEKDRYGDEAATMPPIPDQGLADAKPSQKSVTSKAADDDDNDRAIPSPAEKSSNTKLQTDNNKAKHTNETTQLDDGMDGGGDIGNADHDDHDDHDD